jgi:hypothetical protein
MLASEADVLRTLRVGTSTLEQLSTNCASSTPQLPATAATTQCPTTPATRAGSAAYVARFRACGAAAARRASGGVAGRSREPRSARHDCC